MDKKFFYICCCKIQRMKRAFSILLRFVSSLLKRLESKLKCAVVEFAPLFCILLIINYLSIDYDNNFFDEIFDSNNLPEMRNFWQNGKNRFII